MSTTLPYDETKKTKTIMNKNNRLLTFNIVFTIIVTIILISISSYLTLTLREEVSELEQLENKVELLESKLNNETKIRLVDETTTLAEYCGSYMHKYHPETIIDIKTMMKMTWDFLGIKPTFKYIPAKEEKEELYFEKLEESD